MLLQLGERLAGGFDPLSFGVELEVGVVLLDGVVPLLQLLRYLRVGEVYLRIVRKNFYGVLGAEMGGGEIAVAFIEPGDAQVLRGTVFVGLELMDLGEFSAHGFGFGCVI